MKLSVIVPVFNEENTIVQLLKKLVVVNEVNEVIIVDDGSTDTTLKQIKSQQ